MPKWRCTVCNYIHEGETPPDKCPVCGVGPEKFVRVSDDEAAGAAGEPETLEEARDRCREKLRGICAVYPRCDGDKNSICQREAYGKPIGLGGVGSGLSFQANVAALAKVELRTRVVGPHFDADTQLTFLGRKLSMPILGASTSGVSKYNDAISEDDFCRACVEGCKEAGTMTLRGDTFFYTVKENPALDAIEAAGGWGIPIFKPRAQDALKELIERAEKTGCPAVGVDLDGCGSSNFARAGKPVYRKTIEDMKELVGFTELPFIFKGIMDADDAEACVAAGAKVVAVSNHGGRVLDGTPGVADVLPGIVDRVDGSALVTADGGVRTGYDVLKLLGLGATAVLIGRDVIRAAIGGGSKGVELQMNRLGSVLRKGMLMTGCKDLASIDRRILD